MKTRRVKLKQIVKSSKKTKKWDAIFLMPDGKEKKVSFGALKYEDYTIHKDPERKQRYINRHKKNEHWDDPTTPGSLSRYVLWEEPDFDTSVEKFKKKFDL